MSAIVEEVASVESSHDSNVASSVESTSHDSNGKVASSVDVMSGRLFSAAKEITDEIDECSKTIEKAAVDYQAVVEKAEEDRKMAVEKAEAKREELRVQFQSALNKMQNEFGIKPKSSPKVATERKSIKELIVEFLEKHGEVRTKEIRNYLQARGKSANPGVELSRMVKDGAIINKERGIYVLPKK